MLDGSSEGEKKAWLEGPDASPEIYKRTRDPPLCLVPFCIQQAATFLQPYFATLYNNAI